MIVLPSDIIHGKFQPPTLIRYRDMPCRLDKRVTWHHINRHISRRIRFQTYFLCESESAFNYLSNGISHDHVSQKKSQFPLWRHQSVLGTSDWLKIKSRLRWHSWYTMNMCAKFQGMTMSCSKVFGKHTDIHTYIHTYIQTDIHNNVYYNKMIL